MEKIGKAVGYVRYYEHWNIPCEMQKKKIMDYCVDNGIDCAHIYSDHGYVRKRRVEDIQRAELIGISNKRWSHMFPGWETMMVDIIQGHVNLILVDTALRLYCNLDQKQALDRLCRQYGVKVIEVGGHTPVGSAGKRKLAIYHYSIQPEKRTSVTLKDIDKLYEFTSQNFKGWEVSLYLDLDEVRRVNLEIVLRTDVDVILVKNFFHINRRTIAFMSVAKMLQKRGIKIVSVEEGELRICEEPDCRLLKQPLKAVVYDYFRTEHEKESEDIQMAKFGLFVKHKTEGWTIEGRYIDGLGDNRQVQLQKMIRESGQFEVVIVDTFSKIGNAITNLDGILKEIKVPVYSLKEGMVELNG